MSEWEHTTNMVLQDDCCKDNVEVSLRGHRGCSGDADFPSVTEDEDGVEATAEAPTHQNALSSANNSATITKPLENSSSGLGGGGGCGRGLLAMPAASMLVNLHSEVFADARLPQEEAVVEAEEMEQKTKKSWHHPNEEKTTLAASKKATEASKTASAAAACTTLPKDFRKTKQMLNDVSKRAEMASLFWPQLCTCCQHYETRGQGYFQHHAEGGGHVVADRGHKWRLRNTSCPEPPVHWSSVCNDLVASYIHNGSTPRPPRLLNTKDLQMTSSSCTTTEASKLITVAGRSLYFKGNKLKGRLCIMYIQEGFYN